MGRALYVEHFIFKIGFNALKDDAKFCVPHFFGNYLNGYIKNDVLISLGEVEDARAPSLHNSSRRTLHYFTFKSIDLYHEVSCFVAQNNLNNICIVHFELCLRFNLISKIKVDSPFKFRLI
jgi:hypothetical protein